MAFFPRPGLSERGRAGWVLAAVVAGVTAVVVAVLRGDVAAAVLIALALVAIVAAWRWGRRPDDGEPEP